MSDCQVFNEQEIASFRRAGEILGACLAMLTSAVKPGITTLSLDQLAEAFIREKGGLPAFKGYNDYPFTICTSVNEECVHGMPGQRVLKEGDVISLDCGVIVDGLYTDAARTVGVGMIDPDGKRVIDAAEEAMRRVLPLVRKGVRVGDLSATIQATAKEFGCRPVKHLVGHGLGRTLHCNPDIPNEGKKGGGAALPAGTVIAIEPILTLGKGDIVHEDDGWTIRTTDRKLASHMEHTILVLEGGYEILA